jgi:hypothetical protein
MSTNTPEQGKNKQHTVVIVGGGAGTGPPLPAWLDHGRWRGIQPGRNVKTHGCRHTRIRLLVKGIGSDCR